MFKYTSILTIILSIVISGCTGTSVQKQNPQMTTKVYLDNSEVFSVYSPTIDQQYRIQVRLPGNYQQQPDMHYPVIIKVDGQWDFLLASSAVNCVYFDGQMPEAIVIGIDWGEVEGDIHAIRSRDLLPTPIPGVYPNSGKAEQFTNALADEILPQIEKRYRTNGKRVLLGGSWGGLYTTYALLLRPDAFFGAISIAGDYSHGFDKIQTLLKAHAKGDLLKDNRLYIGVGHWDPITPSVENVANTIEQANIPGLNFKFDLREGFGHSGMNIPGYAAGYQFVFERPEVPVSGASLVQLLGLYEDISNNKNTLKIGFENGQLTAESSQGKIGLQAKSQTQFYHPGIFYNLDFDKNLITATTFFGQSQYRKVN